MSKLFFGILLSSWFVCSAGAVVAGIEPWNTSYGEIAYAGNEDLVLFNLPSGNGDPFTEAQAFGGIAVDATLTIHLRDALDQPVAGFPAEDLWLNSVDGGLVPCTGGTCADGPTDAAGVSTWSQPLRAGGASTGLTQMVINGSPMYDTAGYGLYYVSPDLNGDLIVNLIDVSLWAQDFFTQYEGYKQRSDFVYDGILNLSDLGRLAYAVGDECP